MIVDLEELQAGVRAQERYAPDLDAVRMRIQVATEAEQHRGRRGARQRRSAGARSVTDGHPMSVARRRPDRQRHGRSRLRVGAVAVAAFVVTVVLVVSMVGNNAQRNNHPPAGGGASLTEPRPSVAELHGAHLTQQNCSDLARTQPVPLAPTDTVTAVSACVGALAGIVGLSPAQSAAAATALILPDPADTGGRWCSGTALPPVTLIVRLSSGRVQVPALPRAAGNCHLPVPALLSLLEQLWSTSTPAPQKTSTAAPTGQPTLLAGYTIPRLTTDQPSGDPCVSSRPLTRRSPTITQLVICRPGSAGSTAYVPSPADQSANLAALALPDQSEPRLASDGAAQGCTDPALQIRYVAKLSDGTWVALTQPRQHGRCLPPIDQVLIFNRDWITRVPLN